jgi:hypothetical protein
VAQFGDLAADDLVAIHSAIATYGHVMDAKAWNRFDEVFSDHAVLDLSGYGMWIAEGLEEITEKFPTLDHPRGHLTTNTVIEGRADGTATARSKYMAVHDEHTLSLGVYVDTAARTDRGWRLTRRALHPLGQKTVYV